MSDFINDYSYRIIGPVMYKYTQWILSEAVKHGFKKLYFLARDGYLLFEMAKKICASENIKIDCKYLYCSRQSLRMPSYHLIGDEAYDLLFLGGYYITPKTLLDRPMISKELQEDILNEIGVNDKNAPLTEKELWEIRKKLSENNSYKNAVYTNSHNAYAPAIDYLKSMGLFDDDYIAIVDSGWSGSMQRSLRQLVSSAGYCGKITGFYFGLYNTPKEDQDGEYLTFYFDSKHGLRKKVYFNNNLFECMLSANHPMTIGYTYTDSSASPIFAPETAPAMLSLIESQINGALRYVDCELEKQQTTLTNDYTQLVKECYKILKRAMTRPTKDEADIYSAFTFCDDVTEGYQISLSGKELVSCLKSYVIITRFFKKIFKTKRADEAQLLWVYGVISHASKILQPWYRLNVCLWDFFKALLKKS